MAAALGCALPGLCAPALAQEPPITVGLIADRSDTPLAEDMAAALAHQSVRVLPIVGQGPVQNAADLLHLEGVGFAILPSDLFAYLVREKLFPEAVGRIRLVMEIYYRQFHLLARAEVPDMAALAGRKVGFGPKDSDDDITATLVFEAAGVTPVPVYLDEPDALRELVHGRIDAIAVTAHAPAPVLQAVNREQGIHLLPVDMPALHRFFRSGRLGVEDYPLLIGAGEAGRGEPVPTVEIGEELATTYDFPPDSARSRNAARLVDALLQDFDTLRATGRDRRWREADLSRNPRGWIRFAPQNHQPEQSPAR
jgi:uncharacterized protein